MRVFAALFLCALMCAPVYGQKYTPKNSRNYEVETLSSGQGTKEFKIYVTERNERRAIPLAKMAAVEVCVFRGLPASGSVSGTPALCSSSDEERHAAFFEEFFAPGGRYLQYVNVTSEGRLSDGDKIKVKGGWKIGLTVQVLYDNLRNDLQEEGIVRSLNSGF
ncbi:MAG TPA: hypothetical protein IAC03_02495 [Candidatus Coprenecus pullistercoris]|nr:hypothetical protein [Candidatus Coprenecus pullistercoris]